jgi:hypothetical protein
MRRSWWLLCLLLAFWLIWSPPAMAHVGAPYPVLLEEAVGPYIISALADPDVGKGTFYILVTTAGAEPTPAGTMVRVWVEPEDGHTGEMGYAAERQVTRYGERFVAEVPFDAEGPWQVRLVVEGSAGIGETSFPVRVTPSGIGWLATLACLLPFVVLGVLWLKGSLRQRGEDRRR